jgi:hemolysin III
MLGGIWALALGGISYKMLFPWQRDSHLSTLVYVGMGWLAIILLPQLINLMPLGQILLVSAGGVIYTVGAVIYALDNPAPARFSLYDAWTLSWRAAACTSPFWPI